MIKKDKGRGWRWSSSVSKVFVQPTKPWFRSSAPQKPVAVTETSRPLSATGELDLKGKEDEKEGEDESSVGSSYFRNTREVS